MNSNESDRNKNTTLQVKKPDKCCHCFNDASNDIHVGIQKGKRGEPGIYSMHVNICNNCRKKNIFKGWQLFIGALIMISGFIIFGPIKKDLGMFLLFFGFGFIVMISTPRRYPIKIDKDGVSFKNREYHKLFNSLNPGVLKGVHTHRKKFNTRAERPILFRFFRGGFYTGLIGIIASFTKDGRSEMLWGGIVLAGICFILMVASSGKK